MTPLRGAAPLPSSRERPPPAFHAAAGLALATCAALAACTALAACRPAPPAPAVPDAPYTYAQPLGLVLRGGALVPYRGEGGSPALPAHEAPAVTALAARGDLVAVSVNRVGLFLLRLRPADPSLGLEAAPDGRFGSRSAGALLAIGPDGDPRFIASLYRHPSAADAPSTAGGDLLAFDPGSRAWSEAWLPAGFPREGLFEVHALRDGTLLASSRVLRGARIETLRQAWSLEATTPPGAAGARALGRAAFEEALAPAPSASAPPALRAALRALADLAGTGSAPLLVEATWPDGTRAWYRLGPGDPADAIEVLAALDHPGDLAIACLAGGPVVSAVSDGAGGFTARPEALSPPIPGASWSAVLVSGAPGGPRTLVMAWREDLFPDIGASGLVVAPLGRTGP